MAAADGALVLLMAHLRFPADIGVWLKHEAPVIHCSEQHGVCCESVLALRQMGWKKLTFYEPIICYEKPQLRHSRRAIVEVRRREQPAKLTNLQVRKICFPGEAMVTNLPYPTVPRQSIAAPHFEAKSPPT